MMYIAEEQPINGIHCLKKSMMCVELWSELPKLSRFHKLVEQEIFLSPFKYGNQNVPKGDVLIFSVSGLKKPLKNGNP